MTDQCWPSQSTADKLPLIFTPSVFDASRLGAAAEMMDSPHIRGRMRICFSTLLMKSCCLLQCFSSKVASILFQTKCVCFHSSLSLLPSRNSKFLGPVLSLTFLFGLYISSLKTCQIVSLMMHFVGGKKVLMYKFIIKEFQAIFCRETPDLVSQKEKVAADEKLSMVLISALPGPHTEFPSVRCSSSFNDPFFLFIYIPEKVQKMLGFTHLVNTL